MQINRERYVKCAVYKVLHADDRRLDGERLIGGHHQAEKLLDVAPRLDGCSQSRLANGSLNGLVTTAAHEDLHLVEGDSGRDHCRLCAIFHWHVHGDGFSGVEAFSSKGGVHRHILTALQKDRLLGAAAHGDEEVVGDGRLDDDLLDKTSRSRLFSGQWDGHANKILYEAVIADHRRWKAFADKWKEMCV